LMVGLAGWLSFAPAGAWFVFEPIPTAGAVGCHLSPLRGSKMPWSVVSPWLIPALPILAQGVSALARPAGAERRQKVAHGVSRGVGVKDITSQGEA
jgi:hypothetical protein